jgi:hypothetical protein
MKPLYRKTLLRFLPIVFALERTNQLNLLPDKDLVDLCPPYRTIPSPEEPRILGCSWVRRMGFGVRARGNNDCFGQFKKT